MMNHMQSSYTGSAMDNDSATLVTAGLALGSVVYVKAHLPGRAFANGNCRHIVAESNDGSGIRAIGSVVTSGHPDASSSDEAPPQL